MDKKFHKHKKEFHMVGPFDKKISIESISKIFETWFEELLKISIHTM